MAIQRLSNATTSTPSNQNSNFDDESRSSLSKSGSNGRNTGNSITSSPLSRSRNKLVLERPSLHEQLTQRLLSQNSTGNRRHQISCGSHRTILTAILLGCFTLLSYTMNLNATIDQRMQSTLSPLGQESLAIHKLSLIPSIDELMIGVSSQPFREEILGQQQVSRVGASTDSPIGLLEKIDVIKPTSKDIDFSLNRPPLDTIINRKNEIIGDPEWLLDFAILGYGKCGTSTMMHWLGEHPELQAFGQEKWQFMTRKPGLMVRQLYEDLKPGPYQRGYKAPQDVTQIHILNYYRTYWPKAKLILGIRHPVRWFESLYNFRIQNAQNASHYPHPNNLIGPCRQFLTCTNKGDFAYSLLKLGQQNYPKPRPATELELAITGRYNPSIPFNSSTVEYMYNPIFIFELDQLGDSNATRNEVFRSDFTRFMGLKEPLPALPHYIPGKKRETKEQIRRNLYKIKICNDEYLPVRKDLMKLAQATSQWIREVFLNGPTVHVSSKEYFLSILDGWMTDPCDDVVRMSKTTIDEATED